MNPEARLAELKLELPVDAHIPATYVDSERLRLEAYLKLSAASGESGTREQLDEVAAFIIKFFRMACDNCALDDSRRGTGR